MKRAILCALLALPAPAADLTTTEGKVYKNFTIRKVEPDGLAITHESGLAKVPFTKLSKEIQKEHGYDPEKAAQFAKERAEKDEAARREIDAGVREKKGKAERESAIAAFTEQWSEIAMIIDQSTDEGILGEAFLGATSKGKARNIEETISLGKVFVIGPQAGKVVQSADRIAGILDGQHGADVGRREPWRALAVDGADEVVAVGEVKQGVRSHG